MGGGKKSYFDSGSGPFFYDRDFSLCLTGDRGCEVFIDFDEGSAPPAFSSTSRLSNKYADLGVTFEGASADDGGAVVDYDGGGWTFTGNSPDNFLAFNTGSMLSGGGVAQGPETIYFDPPIVSLAMLVATSEDEGEGEGSDDAHTADQDDDSCICLSELLRVIQLFNSDGFHCQGGTEGQYCPGHI